MVAIGIDLGTTYSCVGVWQHDKVEIIVNDQGNRTTPSYVAFTNRERLIGEAAKNQIAINSNNTVFDAKRLIGRRYEDGKLQEDLKHWPFKVVNDCSKPCVQVKYKGEMKKFAPEEISSMVLSKMKETAETFLGTSVKDVVITVPAYFNDAQRQATKDAGTIAGLNVLRIINEPTAAALAYGLDQNINGEKNILVFDLGGGTFDVSVLTVDDGKFFEVKATAGDTHLGGEDFDNRLVNYLAIKFKKKFNQNILNNPKALGRLRVAAEKAKCLLSTSTEANVEVDSLCDGIDFYTKVSRAKFEELCGDLFRSTLQPLQRVLNDSRLDKSSIHEIVLVGGSTRIPKIQTLLQQFFNGKTLNLSINPDEAVAYGAAVQAAILSGEKSPIIQDMLLVDVAPLSLGIRTTGGLMYKLIDRNTIVPCKHVRTFSTHKDNQTRVPILVYEGERLMTKDNSLLGRFDLTEIKSAPRGEPQIHVTFDLDNNGILSVSAIDNSSGKSGNIVISKDRVCLSASDIERMVNDAEKYKDEDNKERARIEAKNELENTCFNIRDVADSFERKLTDEEKSFIKTKCDETLKWLENNMSADKEIYENIKQELKNGIDEIMCNLVTKVKESDSQTNNESQPKCSDSVQVEEGSTEHVGVCAEEVEGGSTEHVGVSTEHLGVSTEHIGVSTVQAEEMSTGNIGVLKTLKKKLNKVKSLLKPN